MDDQARFLAELEARLAALRQDSECEGRQANEVSEVLDRVSGKASSTDRAITVTVDSGGSPTDLVLTDRVTTRTPARLAADILACIRTAQANLADAVREQTGANPFAERVAQGYESRYPRPTWPAAPPVRQQRPPALDADDEEFGEHSVLVPAYVAKGDR